MDNNEFLPIGSVVLLKNAEAELMIIGYKARIKNEQTGNETNIFDYVGCRMDRGIGNITDYRYFNRDQIDKIICLGYQDELWVKIKELLSN